MYSQNNEERIILNYFSNRKGNFLDIGANDGITLSNVRALAEMGWKGCLVEPSKKAYNKAVENYKQYKDVHLFNCAISDKTGHFEFYESGEHLGNGDHSLLSSLKEDETKRWTKEEFIQTTVNCFKFRDWLLTTKYNTFNFISIDAEGYDYQILTQINLKNRGTELICVEHNGKDVMKYVQYCEKFKMKVIAINNENVIMGL